ncbi:MAG: DUF4910 domain-containing protein [Candidatus Heimdallarchaeota archaeon]|nr:DUF4910 domain-containing protein [Candidatus Heimdallarchaeota archaeon]
MSLEKLILLVSRELSGERAKRITGLLSQYHRIQASKEFLTASKIIYDKLKKLGDNNCQIHEYIADGTKRYYEWYAPLSWDIQNGELLQIEPVKQVLCRFSETPESICTHSKSVDIEAEVIHIGNAKPDEIEGKDIQGKLVLTTRSPRTMIDQLKEMGALGIISYPSEERAKGHSEMIQYVGLWPNADNKEDSTFGFSLSRKQANKLIAQINQNKKVLVKAKIDAELYEGNMHVVSSKIKGTKKSEEEIILIAHICHPAPSANDNASGSALLLEIFTALYSMIEEGIIERPHRTIRFLWVPEFHGTVPWIMEKKKDPTFKPVFCINLDMVGEHPVHVGYPFTFFQSSVSTPSYLNDIIAEVIEHVKDELTAVEQGGWQFPWNFRIVPFSGGSDHVLLNDEPFRIPSVMFGHPDTFHHTNLDTIEKVDQTTLKRVGMTALSTIIIGSNLDHYSEIILAAYTAGYQKRKGHLINMLTAEIRKNDLLQSSEKFIHLYLIGKIIEQFINNEKKSISLMQNHFVSINENALDYLKNDLNSLIEIIKENHTIDFNHIIDEEFNEKFNQIPRRRWIGPINNSEIYKMMSPDFKLNEFPKISEKQITELKKFLENSSGVYGGYLLEITNLIDNKRTVLDILTTLSLVNWQIIDVQILETFLYLIEYLGYITL